MSILIGYGCIIRHDEYRLDPKNVDNITVYNISSTMFALVSESIKIIRLDAFRLDPDVFLVDEELLTTYQALIDLWADYEELEPDDYGWYVINATPRTK